MLVTLAPHRLRVALIGAGSWAHQHAAAWRAEPGADIVVVYNRTRQRARAFADQHGIPQVISGTSPSAAIARDDIDIVSISMPDHLHFPIAMEALKAGKHVFCEKPLTRCADTAQQLADKASELGLHTGMQSTRRTLPLLRRMHQLIQQGYVGDIVSVHMSFSFGWAGDPDTPFTWRFSREHAGAGAIADLGVYMIDAARWLVGEFTAVCGHQFVAYAQRTTQNSDTDCPGEIRSVENADEAIFLATFDRGAHGVFRASRLHDDQSVRIWGTEGTLILEHMTPDGYDADAGVLWGRRRGADAFEAFRADSLTTKSIVSDFTRSIHGKATCAPDFYDGWRAQVVIDAVDAAVKDGTWVTIPHHTRPGRGLP